MLFQDVVRCDYFKEIQRITTSLKGCFADVPEKLLEIHQIEKVAERNRIALNVINQLGASDPSLRVSLELMHHPHFAVVVVKRLWFIVLKIGIGIEVSFGSWVARYWRVIVVLVFQMRLHLFCFFSHMSKFCLGCNFLIL